MSAPQVVLGMRGARGCLWGHSGVQARSGWACRCLRAGCSRLLSIAVRSECGALCGGLAGPSGECGPAGGGLQPPGFTPNNQVAQPQGERNSHVSLSSGFRPRPYKRKTILPASEGVCGE